MTSCLAIGAQEAIARGGKTACQRRDLAAVVISIAVAALLACTPTPTVVPKTPIASLPTPSLTSTPTATPTETPPPTTTATPSPPSIAVKLKPPQVKQGHTLFVEVRTDRPVELKAALDDRPLPFVEDGERYWALAGFTAWSEVGPHTLSLTATDLMGNRAQVTVTVEVKAADFPLERVYLPPDRLALLDPGVVMAEVKRLAPIFEDFTPERFWKGLFTRPAQGDVSSPFGTRRSYNGQPPRSHHGGVDFSAPEGTAVVAANSGQVVLAEDLQVRGKSVILDHGLGVYSCYCHLSEIGVQFGQWVDRGDLIGHIGQTGLTAAPHLHWEVRVGGVNVDPLEWARKVWPGAVPLPPH